MIRDFAEDLLRGFESYSVSMIFSKPASSPRTFLVLLIFKVFNYLSEKISLLRIQWLRHLGY